MKDKTFPPQYRSQNASGNRCAYRQTDQPVFDLTGTRRAGGFIKLALFCLPLVLLAVFLSLLWLRSDPDAAWPSMTVSLSSDNAEGISTAALRSPLENYVDSTDDTVSYDPFFGDEDDPGFSDAASGHQTGDLLTITSPTGAGPKIIHIRPSQKRDGPLPAAPMAGFYEKGPYGPLPKIASDGRKPWQAYARPFQRTGHPVIAIIVGGLGLDPEATRMAIRKLPSDITLAFAPHADNLQGWVDEARRYGHEVILQVPMEAHGAKSGTSGRNTLLAHAKLADNTKRLDWLMGRTTGYFAVMNYLGGKFLGDKKATEAVFTRLAGRGMAFIHDGAGQEAEVMGLANKAGMPYFRAGKIIDARRNQRDIDVELLNLVVQARRNKQALGFGFAYPETLERLKAWSQKLEKRGIRLAPVSALLAQKTQEQAKNSGKKEKQASTTGEKSIDPAAVKTKKNTPGESIITFNETITQKNAINTLEKKAFPPKTAHPKGANPKAAKAPKTMTRSAQDDVIIFNETVEDVKG